MFGVEPAGPGAAPWITALPARRTHAFGIDIARIWHAERRPATSGRAILSDPSTGGPHVTDSTFEYDADAASAELARAVPGLAQGYCPLPGVATAGQPGSDQLRAIAAAGYRAVLDLRAPGETRGYDEVAVARQAGLRYENLPVTAATLKDADFDRVRAFLSDESNVPLLVHCASANRVGALLLPYLVLDLGRSMDDALAAAQRIGLRSADMAEAAVRYIRSHGGPAH